MDSKQEWQHSYNEPSDGIPMLASDSDESVIFVVGRPLPSVQGPGITARAASQAPPTFSSSGNDTSSFGKYLLNIIYDLK